MGTVIPSGGCIRFYSTGPEWHTDEKHKAIGYFEKEPPLSIDSAGYLIIPFLNDDGSVNTLPVIWMDPASDEELTKRGISMGASNGGPYMRVRFYKDGVGYLDLTEDYALIQGSTSNGWIKAEHWDPS